MSESSISVDRVIKAKPEDIWEALTKPDQVSVWWGPTGFKSTISKMDVKPGGSWDFIMHGPDGTDYPNSLTYEDVEENKRLSYVHHENKEYGLAAWKAEVTIEDLGDKCKVTLTNVFANEEEKAKHVNMMGAVQGANQTLERLAEQVEGIRD
jgi:uncharacterized protein YndB with AHSA1/START domain